MKQYLGDGVYIEIENGMFKLITDNGLEITNEIYLEPCVAEKCIRYMKAAMSQPVERE